MTTERKPRRLVKYEQVYSGEWETAPKGDLFSSCCDCGLVHRVRHRVTPDGRVQWVAWREARRTAARRRSKGLPYGKKAKPL